jgi:hypothetical protein
VLDHYLDADSRDVVKSVIGLVSTAPFHSRSMKGMRLLKESACFHPSSSATAVVRAIALPLGLSMWLLTGCQSLGPAALSAGRGAYNDVIARTSSEQMLALLVRLRYSDPFGLLVVSNVTASLRFTADATAQAGFGPRANYAGNLVPFSAGLAYEDSPTISYAPVDAQAFEREWLVPVRLEMLALLMQAARQDGLILLLVERMNGLRQSARTTTEEETAFQRAATLLAELRDLGIASWAQQSGVAGRFELILSHYSPGHVAEVQELLRLLELTPDPERKSVIRIPVALGVREGDFNGLAMQTRSMEGILRTAAASIDVPDEHVEAGVVMRSADALRAAGAMHPILKIHSSRFAPDQASVAVQHRGWWFYVDDTDLASKWLFLEIQTLFLARLSEATRGTQATPLLTIPVK